LHGILGEVPCVFAWEFSISDDGNSTDSGESNPIIKVGFTGAYADENACGFGNYCTPVYDSLVVELGFTSTVDDDPFESNPNQETSNDYFFLKGVEPVSAEVDLNGDKGPFVSAYSGVFVELP
jgi:hypothetical protein